MTGDATVIHLSPTRDARAENVEKSQQAGVSFAQLLSRADPAATSLAALTTGKYT